MATITNSIPASKIDKNFSNQLEELKIADSAIYQSVVSTAQRFWQNPVVNVNDPSGWDFNVFNITGIKSAFDRTEPNNIYVQSLTRTAVAGATVGEGRVADCTVEKIQIDYLASQERAYRLRQSSSIRCAMHAAVRRRGHSKAMDKGYVAITAGGTAEIVGPVGGAFTTLVRYLQLLISGGYNQEGIISSDPVVVSFSSDGTPEVVNS